MQVENEMIGVLKHLYNYRLTTSSGGNLSAIDSKESVWITPAAIDKGNLTVNDLVKINKNGKIKGKHIPSSEYPLHQLIYNNCPEIKAILHAHPPSLVAYCITGEKIITKIQPDIYHICGEIGYVPYFSPGSMELANAVAAEFKNGFSIVMLQNHGVVIGSHSITDAYVKMVILNSCAEASILAKQLGKLNLLTSEQIKLAQVPTFFDKKSPKKSHFFNDNEICKSAILLSKRAFKQNLLNGFLGSISIKKSNKKAILSQKFTDWGKIQDEDFISLYKMEETFIAKNYYNIELYKKIFKKHPHIRCIIHAYAPACFAYSLTDYLFETKTVPESYIILRDIAYSVYESFYIDNDQISDLLSDTKPLVFLKNNGVIVAGSSVIQAFDRLEVAEYTAKSIIAAKGIGTVRSIGEEEIDKIEKKYPVK